MSKELTVRNERGIITRYGIIGPWDWRLAMTQFGADWYTPQGTRCIVDSEAGIAAMDFMHSLIYEHEVMPTPQAQSALASAGGWGAGEITLFGAERGAMAIGARWWLAILRTPDYQHLDLGAVQVPGLRRPDGTMSHTVYGYGRATLVNARTKHKEGALLFQEYLHGQEYNEMVNRQADALAPVKKYCYTEEYLFNPEHPEEDYNEVWRTALENSEPMANSPYVNGATAERLLQIQTDLVKGDLKDAASAMHDAAAKINREIIKTLERDERLRKRYLEDIANGAAPAWNDPSEIPWEDAA
jgi:ABC-type glycerol-3-phosphate transport system substrate-binding protein